MPTRQQLKGFLKASGLRLLDWFSVCMKNMKKYQAPVLQARHCFHRLFRCLANAAEHTRRPDGHGGQEAAGG